MRTLTWLLGVLLVLFGMGLYLEHFGVPGYILNTWHASLLAVSGFFDSQQFSDYATYAGTVLSIVAGLVLIYWGMFRSTTQK